MGGSILTILVFYRILIVLILRSSAYIPNCTPCLSITSRLLLFLLVNMHFYVIFSESRSDRVQSLDVLADVLESLEDPTLSSVLAERIFLAKFDVSEEIRCAAGRSVVSADRGKRI